MSRDDRIFIGTLVERTGVPADTIRYWEDEGVLPEPDRSDAGYRLYGETAVERLGSAGPSRKPPLTAVRPAVRREWRRMARRARTFVSNGVGVPAAAAGPLHPVRAMSSTVASVSGALATPSPAG